MFQVGDIVRIRPEWLDHPEKPGLFYTVVNVNEVTKRCIIEALNTGLPLAPQETVSFEMIETVYKKEEIV